MLMNGIVLGKYEIEKVIGSGTFSVVFRAKEVRCERIVAIKALDKEIYKKGASKYVEAEIRALGRIWGHPNIVSIHTVEPGDDEYEAYIVMEYIDGPSLKREMSKGKIPLCTAISIGLDICNGLAYAHEHNIIHRDIKPQNILLTSDFAAKLTDFGVARILEETEYAKTVTGTRRYMAPEQYTKNYDKRVDVYATGLVLYEMLTGRYPFKGDINGEIEGEKQTKDLVIPDSIPEQLSAVLNKALQRDPKKRDITASGMYDELYRIRSDMFESYVVKVMENGLESDAAVTAITTRREELKIPEPIAENIARQAWEKTVNKSQEREREEAKVRTMKHYEQARKYLTANQPQLAFAELQQMVDINLDEGEPKGLVKDIFTRIKMERLGMRTQDGGMNYESLIELIKRLPEEELKLLRASLDDEAVRSKPQTEETQELHKETPPEARLGATSMGKNYFLEAQKFQKEADEFAKQKKNREMQQCMRKSGGAYRKYAGVLSKGDCLEEAALCYKKAAKSYKVGGKYRTARKYYAKAAAIHYKLAENYAKERRWYQAGQLFQTSAETYASAGKPDKSETSLKKAVASYYNIAKNLYSNGNLEDSLKCCRIAIDVWNGRGGCAPVNDARVLLNTIESDISEGKMNFE